MKTFYEMMQILREAEDQGLGDQSGDQNLEMSPEEGMPEEPTSTEPNMPPDSSSQEPVMDEDLKNYMFFSSLKVIKKKVEEILQMDPKEIDAMIEDGHDWASEHVITAKDDIEEVYNWIISR